MNDKDMIRIMTELAGEKSFTVPDLQKRYGLSYDEARSVAAAMTAHGTAALDDGIAFRVNREAKSKQSRAKKNKNAPAETESSRMMRELIDKLHKREERARAEAMRDEEEEEYDGWAEGSAGGGTVSRYDDPEEEIRQLEAELRLERHLRRLRETAKQAEKLWEHEDVAWQRKSRHAAESRAPMPQEDALSWVRRTLTDGIPLNGDGKGVEFPALRYKDDTPISVRFTEDGGRLYYGDGRATLPRIAGPKGAAAGEKTSAKALDAVAKYRAAIRGGEIVMDAAAYGTAAETLIAFVALLMTLSDTDVSA